MLFRPAGFVGIVIDYCIGWFFNQIDLSMQWSIVNHETKTRGKLWLSSFDVTLLLKKWKTMYLCCNFLLHDNASIRTVLLFWNFDDKFEDFKLMKIWITSSYDVLKYSKICTLF